MEQSSQSIRPPFATVLFTFYTGVSVFLIEQIFTVLDGFIYEVTGVFLVAIFLSNALAKLFIRTM